MYEVIFESDSGKKYVFGKNGNTVFDMDLGNGMSVDIGTSQGFSQIGETVEGQSVTGRPINVKGTIFGDVVQRKRIMRNIIAPFTSGRLIFGDYFTRVYVKSAPTFSTIRDDGRFSLQFFAPFPFFYGNSESTVELGGVTPLFKFPVNYAIPHKFGERANEKYSNIVNSGDVKVPFRITLQSMGTSTNPTISNLTTFESLKLNGVLYAGDSIDIYRDDHNIMRVDLYSGGVVSDATSWVDEDSTLFELNVGDNLIAANDDEGGAGLTARFSFNPAVAALYES